MRAIRVLIADDSPHVLKIFSRLLEASGGIEVVGLARDGLEAVTRAEEMVPDVVILDVKMPELDGIEAAGRIKQALSNVGILLVSGSTEYRRSGALAGVDGFLNKPVAAEALVREVKNIARKYW